MCAELPIVTGKSDDNPRGGGEFHPYRGLVVVAITINHNLMALNASRNLQSGFRSLTSSVGRLSSGLRIATSAADPAGLAVSELMRSDISALKQGVRNATTRFP